MKLTVREKASFGMGAIGKDMVYMLVASFFMYYCTTVLKVSGTFVGTLFLFARVFDALNDPLMGVVVEKTNTRFGKFRPWLLIGTILNAIILVGMFSVPETLSGTGLKVYISISYILWGVTYTLMDIPYWSMIPAITKSGTDRENLSVIARTCAAVGSAVPTVLTTIVVPRLGGGSEYKGYSYFSILIALFFILSLSICVYNVKEHKVKQQKTVTVKQMFESLFKNDQALVVVVSIIMFNASLYITQQLAVYFFRYDIGNAELYSTFAIVAGLTQILAMVSIPVLRKKFESKHILMGAIGVTLAGYLVLFAVSMLNTGTIALLYVAAMIVFFGFGVATVLTTIFLADTVDYGEWKNNQRNESVIFSLQTFVVKLASAVSAFIVGVGIDIVGINEDLAVQTTHAIVGLRSIMCIIPMIGLIASIIFFGRKYTLDQKKLSMITVELEARKGSYDQKQQ